MRTRTRIPVNETVPIGPVLHTDYYAVAGGGITSAYNYNVTGNIQTGYVEETIVDDPSPVKTGTLWKSKHVHHVTRSVSQRLLSNDSYDEAGHRYITVGPACYWSAWGNGFVPNITFGHTNPGYTIDEKTALRQTLHAFFNDNDVLNAVNIVEAPELLSGLRSIARNFREIVSIDSRLTRGTAKQALQAALKKGKSGVAILSGGFLYYSFGVAPLISDMRKVSKAMKSISGRIAKAQKQAGTVVTVSRRWKGSGFTWSPTGYPEAGGPVPDLTSYAGLDGKGTQTGNYYAVQLEAEQPLTVTCTVKGVRSLAFDSASLQKWDYLARRFGANGPVSYLWERIPYSFVVDWFVDLSGIIDRLDNALTGNGKKVVDCCISNKWAVRVGVIHSDAKSNSHSNLYNGDQVALVRLSAYSRKPLTPTTTVGLSDRFGKRQIALSAALVGQMAANLRKYR
jgi:hypothetical protein